MRPICLVMVLHELSCPTCEADIPLVGDERVGQELLCLYCGAPSKIRAAEEQQIELEDDY